MATRWVLPPRPVRPMHPAHPASLLSGIQYFYSSRVQALVGCGHSEYFICIGMANTICARVGLAGDTIKLAAATALGEAAALAGETLQRPAKPVGPRDRNVWRRMSMAG